MNFALEDLNLSLVTAEDKDAKVENPKVTIEAQIRFFLIRFTNVIFQAIWS